jgi:hypothetical protein
MVRRVAFDTTRPLRAAGVCEVPVRVSLPESPEGDDMAEKTLRGRLVVIGR